MLPSAGSLGRTAQDCAQTTAVVRDRHAQLRATEINANQGHGYRGSE
jgi:hypothetical protein